MSHPHAARRAQSDLAGGIRHFPDVFKYSGRAFELVWTTSRGLTLLFVALTVVSGLLPAAIAWVGKLIVDSVVTPGLPWPAPFSWFPQEWRGQYQALVFVAIEAVLVTAMAASQRGISICQSLLRALLGQRVNVMILEKAVTLNLAHFEDAEFYDKLTRARREASSRPLSLVNQTFGLVQNAISLVAYLGILLQFSGWAVVILALAGLPAFWVEAKFSGAAFRLFRWRSPETRQQWYLETVLAREDYAKEVKLFQIAPRLLERYRAIFAKLYPEDRDLTLRRGFWGFVLGLLSILALYGAYAWIVVAAVARRITLGDMTMYLLVFKQGQSAFAAILTSIGGMYEDNLYLSNLYELLEHPVEAHPGKATTPLAPGDGVRFEHVRFTYPGAAAPAIDDVTFHLRPGQKLALVGQNGSGKTTLIKLLTGLYLPQEGRVLIDGRDVREWDIDILRKRISVIFQDFVRYQFTVGENVGAGDVDRFQDRERWDYAADLGMAKPFIAEMPDTYDTQLGSWFKGGRELSGGQWQKVALSRAFMREDADIIVLDEPTAAMDAEAEAQIFDHFRKATQNQMAILISHRFSTVRMADYIIVLDHGRVLEAGTHDELMQHKGTYARLFSLQAAGYR